MIFNSYIFCFFPYKNFQCLNFLCVCQLPYKLPFKFIFYLLPSTAKIETLAWSLLSLLYAYFLQHNRKRKNTQGKSGGGQGIRQALGDFPVPKSVDPNAAVNWKPYRMKQQNIHCNDYSNLMGLFLSCHKLYLGEFPQALISELRQVAVTFPLLNSLYSHRGRSSLKPEKKCLCSTKA